MLNPVPNMKKTKKVSADSGAGHVHGPECDHGHGHDHDQVCELRIRQYQPADYKALIGVWKAADIDLDDTDSLKAIEHNLKRNKNGYRIFVAEAQMVDARTNTPNGKPRLAGGVITTYDGRRAYIYHLAVHPDFRSVGLGQALLETCEHQAQLWEAKYLRLTARTNASRAAARKMYEESGWKADQSIWVYHKTLRPGMK